jgi:hypothetical protein
MSTVPRAIQGLARQLIGFERVHGKSSVGAAMRVCEKLRGKLTKFTGTAGYSSLLSRALTLANAQFPALSTVTVRADGALEGFDTIEGPGIDAVENAQAALVAQLLGLLTVFIGETLTLRFVRDIWPDATMDMKHTENDGGGL